jgi:ribosome biogenesis GTPase / thiamine phosphate phosphatase
MELTELGFNDWFQKKHIELGKSEFNIARITRVDKDRYCVINEENEIQAEATGKLLYSADSNQDLPCVGDWVLVQYYNDGTLAIIHEIFPRKTVLHRKAAGKKVDYQMIASNIEAAFIMQSCDNNFNLRRMERYLVMVNDGQIEPIILLSKSDLISKQDLEMILSEISKLHISARVIAFSSLTEDGLQSVKRVLEKGKTYCLLGSSGVGKTTLINHLIGKDEFETAPVREKDSRGRHTTSSRQLIVLDNGALLIDTPGMRELGIISEGTGIDDSFSDIYQLSENCHFDDCTHTKETGCAILKAIEDGDLSEERYLNYIKIMKEAQFNEMSYVERRKKDKQFGKMINTAMKELKKWKPSV